MVKWVNQLLEQAIIIVIIMGDLLKIYHKCAGDVPHCVDDQFEIKKPGLRRGNARVRLAQALA